MASVLVLGHSFVRRMRDWLHSQGDLKLGLHQVSEINYHGVGGYTLYHLWDEIQLIKSLQPDILLLEIGSNDISYRTLSPQTFTDELQHFLIHVLAVTSVQQIVVFQVFYRGLGYNPRRRQRQLRDYNESVRQLNLYLFHMVRKPGMSNHPVTVFRLQGMWSDYTSFLRRDGVHLNNKGQERHKWHYRRAIIDAAARLPPPSQY